MSLVLIVLLLCLRFVGVFRLERLAGLAWFVGFVVFLFAGLVFHDLLFA